MTNMAVKRQIVLRAVKLLEESDLSKGCYGIRKNGAKVHSFITAGTVDCACYCAIGSLARAGFVLYGNGSTEWKGWVGDIVLDINRSMDLGAYENLSNWNDDPMRTKEEVVGLLRRYVEDRIDGVPRD